MQGPVQFFRFAFLAVPLFCAGITQLQAQTFTDVSSRLNYQDYALHGAWAASFVDLDANGLPDIYEPGALYLQQANGDYISSLIDLGIPLTSGTVFGAVYADVNDDGFPEMFTIDLNTGRSIFYRNHKGFILADSTQSSGMTDLLQAQGTVFNDFNGDGKLDMFMGEETGKNQLFMGDGSGQFVETTDGAGIGSIVRSYGVASVDFDNDGDMDVLIAACAPLNKEQSINMFFRNNGDGTFDEIGAAAGVDDNLSSWGITWLDYDRDGYMDTYIVNMKEVDGRTGHNVLYRNNGDGTFTDMASAAGVQGEDLSFSYGTSAADFNNDGWVDLYVANRQAPPYVFISNGDGTFTNRFSSLNVPLVTNNTSISVGDINQDGWLDFFSGGDFAPGGPNGTNRGSILMLNDGGTNGYLTVRLIQEAPNKQGIGARLEVWDEGRVQLRDITAGDGFSSQNLDFSAHFGLGTATSIDSLVIKWPDKTRDRLENVQTNQHLSIQKGGTINRPPTPFGAFSMQTTEVAGKSEANFLWEASSDPEGETITYVVTVKNSEGNIVFESAPVQTPYLTAEFEIDRNAYQYWWVVTASDGLNIRRSLNVVNHLMVTGDATEQHEIPGRVQIIAAYPNPISTKLSVQVKSEAPEALSFELIDILGRSVLRQDRGRVASGTATYQLNVEGLPAGTYVLKVQSGAHLTQKMVVKMNR